MKKYFLTLAIVATVPFILSAIYGLIRYGNAVNNSMGGLEIAVFLAFIAAPIALICLIIFSIKIIRLKRNHLPIKREVIAFLIPILISTILYIGLTALTNYCSKGARYGHYIETCPFIPKTFL